jgi:6-phosphofructokinase 2
MADIITFTVNPSVDVFTSVERVAPFHKLRCTERRDPGGGINVAREMKRFDADVVAMYPAGGAIGQLVGRLLEQEGLGACPSNRKSPNRGE